MFRLRTHKRPLLSYALCILLFWVGTLVMEMNAGAYEDVGAILMLVSAALFLYVFIDQLRFLYELRKEQAKTELLHLKSQVNPHFFFNVLNNLYATVGNDPARGQALILKLSDLMRYSIYEGQKTFVPLAEEVSYLKNFIELQRMRYHRDISVTFTSDIGKGEQQVIPLLFIILLENAFKHGVENLPDGAWVRIDLQTDERELRFAVENNFHPETEEETTGIGLKNLRRRLELAYPKRHVYSRSRTDSVYSARLSLRLP